MYPLRLQPTYIHKPWGGRGLEEFKPNLPSGDVGEAWDISAHPEGDTVVLNGPFAGQPLSQGAQAAGRDLVGTRVSPEHFPLMVRFVSSRENLSIQLHPTDSYASKVGMPSGKDEAWYVLAAEAGAHVNAGLKRCTTQEFREAATNGSLSELVVEHPVAAGDFIYIPAGTVHAICAGLTVIELCENSNTTYRLFDYGRPRGLDLEAGFEVVNVDAVAAPHRGLTWSGDGYSRTYLCLTAKLAASRIDVDTVFAGSTDGGSFLAFTSLGGRLELQTQSGVEVLNRGESILLPADTGHYRLTGSGSVLECHIPDVRAEQAALTGLLT
jgi:mannose-6-phosphate isomerase